jgi:hypothetical protein
LTAALRLPLVRFLALGALLALARAALLAPPEDLTQVIAVTPGVAGRVAAEAGGAGDERAALDAWIEEEVLYREGVRRGLAWNPAAIARLVQVGRFVGASPSGADADVLAEVEHLGLDRGDPLLRTQVAGRMRLLLHERAMRLEPTEGDLQAHLAAHRERYVRPARATFVHVFVARGRGPDAKETVTSLAQRVSAGHLSPALALRFGDAFAGGHRFTSWSAREVEALFGGEVARVVASQPERRWSPPTESPYGWHLLWVERRSGDELPPLEEVRDRVRRAWRAENARREVAARIAELRARHRVEIAPGAAVRLAAAAPGGRAP